MIKAIIYILVGGLIGCSFFTLPMYIYYRKNKKISQSDIE